MILFLVTAQASFSQPEPAPRPSAEPSEPPFPIPAPHAIEGSGTAVFRPAPGLDLGAWIAETLTDDRQSVTAIVRFPADGRVGALGEAERLMAALEAAGARPRLVLEPGQEAESLVVIGYEGAL